jgi:small-conductance mechanosensitive channel
MDLQTTIKLLDAGYTKEEIEKMNPVTSSPIQPAKTPEPEKKQEPEQKPAEPEKGQKETNADTNKIIADLTKQVADLAGVVKSIQDTNAKTVKQDVPAKETAQTVLESFFGKPN